MLNRHARLICIILLGVLIGGASILTWLFAISTHKAMQPYYATAWICEERTIDRIAAIGHVNDSSTFQLLRSDAGGKQWIIDGRTWRFSELNIPRLRDVVKLMDINGDGMDELITYRKPKPAIIHLGQPDVMGVQHILKPEFRQCQELVLYDFASGKCRYVRLPFGMRLHTLAKSKSKGSCWLIGCNFVIDADTGRELYERIVLGYELNTQKSWWFSVAPTAISIQATDLNDDGTDEIIIGTRSPNNGIFVNGMDDMHCYILCLTPTGKQLWLSPPMAGSFTWLQTIVLPEKHRKWRLIAAATYTAYPYRSDEGRLFILNGRTGKLLKPVADLGSSAIGFTAGDVLGDGETELIVGLRTGRIVVYDLQLRKRAQIENGSAISALDNADLDGDGKAEVIALTANMDMLIADFHPDYPSPRLQRIPLPGRYSRPSWLPGDNLKIGDFDGDSHPEALYSAHTIHEPALMVNYVAFYPMSPVEISPHRVIPYSGIKDFDWSPDGMRVVLLRSSNSTMKNNLLIGGINQKRLRCILNTGNITEVAWSPNNKYIAYIHKTTRSELAGIWIYDLHNNTSKVIVKDATAKQLVWSPDSTRIAFVSQRDGTEDIWLVDVRVKSKPYPLKIADSPIMDEFLPYWLSRDEILFQRREYVNASDILEYGGAGKIPLSKLWRATVNGNRLQRIFDDAMLRDALALTRRQRGRSSIEFEIISHWQQLQRIHGSLASPLAIRPTRSYRYKDVKGKFDNPPYKRRKLLAFAIELVRLQANGIYLGPTDVWVYDAIGGTLVQLLRLDECIPVSMDWNADGEWLAVEVHDPEHVTKSNEIWLVHWTGGFKQRVDTGSTPKWSPTDSNLLGFIQNGSLMTARIKSLSFPTPPLWQHPWFWICVGMIVGVTLTITAYAFQLPARMRLIIVAFIDALRQRTQLSKAELIRRTGEAFTEVWSQLHSLKHMLLSTPTISSFDRRTPLTTVERHLSIVFMDENIQAIERTVEVIQSALVVLINECHTNAIAIKQFSPALRKQWRTACNELRRHRKILQRLPVQLKSYARQIERCGQLSERKRRQVIMRIQMKLERLRDIIGRDRHSGLLGTATRALELLELRNIVTNAVDSIQPQLERVDIHLQCPESVSPLLRFAGDPEDLRACIEELLRNAIDAVSERMQIERGYKGSIIININRLDKRVIVQITDNGIGIEPSVLQRIKCGEQVSTKSEERGMGLLGIRSLLSQYANANLQLMSEGLNQGTTATITVPLI